MFGVVSPVSPLSLHIVRSAVPAVPLCSAAVQLMFGVVFPVSPTSLHIVRSAVPAVPQCSAAVQLRLVVVSPVSPVPPAFLRCLCSCSIEAWCCFVRDRDNRNSNRTANELPVVGFLATPYFKMLSRPLLRL